MSLLFCELLGRDRDPLLFHFSSHLSGCFVLLELRTGDLEVLCIVLPVSHLFGSSILHQAAHLSISHRESLGELLSLAIVVVKSTDSETINSLSCEE